MIIYEDGTLYLERGETIPYRCPCGTYIQTREEEFDCDSCGRHLLAEDLKEAQTYEFRPVQ